MSEYIEIETESSDDERVMYVYTNLRLSEEESESYESVELMEEGSPFAQALSLVEGIVQLQIKGSELVITRDLEVPWHALMADVSAIIKDFFL
jgi:hypothetical protein